MKAVVAAFNQEKALVGAFSVITNRHIYTYLLYLLHTPGLWRSGTRGSGTLWAWLPRWGRGRVSTQNHLHLYLAPNPGWGGDLGQLQLQAGHGAAVVPGEL